MPPPSHSEQLRQRIRLAEPRLDEAARAFWTHPRLARMFPEFLLALHSAMLGGVSLMQAAAECAFKRAPTDPAAAGILGYLSKHIREERHHHKWLLEDMVAIGMDRHEILRRAPSPTVAALIGSQYYWVFHAHPVTVLGYLCVLEGKPASARQLNEIRARIGLPPEGFRTLLIHAHEDLQHRDDLKQMINQLPLEDTHITLITLSAFQTIEMVSCLFEEILDSHRNQGANSCLLAQGVPR